MIEWVEFIVPSARWRLHVFELTDRLVKTVLRPAMNFKYGVTTSHKAISFDPAILDGRVISGKR